MGGTTKGLIMPVVRFKSAPGPLDNPLKGWCPYTDAGPITQPYSMTYHYVSWKALEPNPEDYRFAEWERTWEHPLARNKHVVFRVYIDYPTKPSGLPDWLKNAGVRLTPYTDYGGGLAPDYDDPRLLSALLRFIEALGKRYDGHGRVAFVQFGLLGFWGEWHTYPRTELFASPQTQRRVLEAGQKAFPRTPLMTRYPAGYAGTQANLGFFDDLFPQDTDGPEAWKFLPALRRAGRTGNWKAAPLGGEMEPGKAAHWLTNGYTQTMQRLNDAHFSWVGPYCPALEKSDAAPDFLARSQDLVRRMGYTFRLLELQCAQSISVGGAFSVLLTGENAGIAPFYYPWPIEMAFLPTGSPITSDAASPEAHKLPADVRAWLPGPFSLRAALPAPKRAGRYDLALRIRNPWADGPKIRFANDLPRRGDWTLLCPITVTHAKTH